jgi:hypothetical protein
VTTGGDTNHGQVSRKHLGNQTVRIAGAVVQRPREPWKGAHGPPSHFGHILYTPASGFRGLDSFQFQWEYSQIDYSSGLPTSTRLVTNIGTYAIQVGTWVDLLPATTYNNDAHQSMLAVGGSETPNRPRCRGSKRSVERARPIWYRYVQYGRLCACRMVAAQVPPSLFDIPTDSEKLQRAPRSRSGEREFCTTPPLSCRKRYHSVVPP